MSAKKVAVLVLADGTKFAGFSCGADVSVSGEVVFNTATGGYPELLSDPLMRGHIVVLTYPLIGNYGVPPIEELESDRVQLAGLVVTDFSEEYSHWNATKSLGEWLRENNVPAIYGVDTRALAKHLREKGEMSGKIIVADNDLKIRDTRYEIRDTNLAGDFGEGNITICHLGEGLKNSIIASFTRRGVKITTDFEKPCGGYLVTGTVAEASAELVAQVKKALASGKPVFGVCGGDLLLALAAGASIEKLSHSHRGTNQPVIEKGTPHAMITTQNHAWVVTAASLPSDWEVWYENLNDGSVEGIRRRTGFAKGVQFQPEASMRPAEEDKLYDEFVKSCR